MQNHMENIFFSHFIIKLNEDAYEICIAPNIRPLENYFQCVIQLATGRKPFGTSTQQKIIMFWTPCSIHDTSNAITTKI